MTKATNGPANAARVSRSGRYFWLFAQAVFAIAAGAVLGFFVPELAAKMRPLGHLLLKAIKLAIGPIIFLAITTGIAGAQSAYVGS